MNGFTSAFSALKNVLLMQERLERLQEDLQGLAGDLSDLREFTNSLDKRLYALERIIDFGAQQVRQRRIEE